MNKKAEVDIDKLRQPPKFFNTLFLKISLILS